MAKSLRSKSKRAARSLKRKLVFAPVEDERLQRLAKKQAVITDPISDMAMDDTVIENTDMDVVLSKNAIKRLAMSKHQIYKKSKTKKRK
jgi:hypothetical protein